MLRSVGTKVVKVGISIVDCKVTYVNDLRVTMHAVDYSLSITISITW